MPTRAVAVFQFGFLTLGFVGALIVAKKRTRDGEIFNGPRKFMIMGQGALIAITLFAVWVFTLPMEMRGTFLGE